MIESHLLALRFDPGRLKADLAQIDAQAWIPNPNQRIYCDGGWSGLVLSGTGGDPCVELLESNPEREPTAAAILGKCPHFQEVISAFQCPVRAARLFRLDAGATLREHREGEFGEGLIKARIHIPVLTNPDAEFFLNNLRVDLHEGEAWFLRTSLPYRIRNRGHTPRIHLAVDVIVNDWLRSLIPFDTQESRSAPEMLEIAPEIARANLERFREMVRSNPELHAILRDIQDRELFASEVLRVSREFGLVFNRAEIENALRAETQHWLQRWLD